MKFILELPSEKLLDLKQMVDDVELLYCIAKEEQEIDDRQIYFYILKVLIFTHYLIIDL